MKRWPTWRAKEDDKLRNWSKVELKAENRLLALIDITQYMHSALSAFHALLGASSSFAPAGRLPSAAARPAKEAADRVRTVREPVRGPGQRRSGGEW